ncbi:spore germination protein gerPA/gerPF [Thermincola ferriacetica]|uniref:Spore germination protein gerPA/gerPF n=2 Tax=Thermincola TaxID=278993 RepID=D5X9Z9_THEPJ|nr:MULTISPECIES: spore germination protein [Thermincola]ADG83132.1 Spore germination protein gerPA/gerPF [Thermincola potens JR]KNZ70620.1 spore germination protein gerPA/gerPF [Thermincola ferriacetica]
MPGVGVIINLGGYKVNSSAGTAMINIGDTLLTTPQSETKNKVAGAFSAGDISLNNSPNAPIFFDPDLVDNAFVRPVSLS